MILTKTHPVGANNQTHPVWDEGGDGVAGVMVVVVMAVAKAAVVRCDGGDKDGGEMKVAAGGSEWREGVDDKKRRKEDCISSLEYKMASTADLFFVILLSTARSRQLILLAGLLILLVAIVKENAVFYHGFINTAANVLDLKGRISTSGYEVSTASFILSTAYEYLVICSTASCTSHVNKSSSPTDNSTQQDTQPTLNIQPTTEPTTPTNVNAEEYKRYQKQRLLSIPTR
ncbi:hypothetical protein Tco_1464715 [Tanacetum coccineum]